MFKQLILYVKYIFFYFIDASHVLPQIPFVSRYIFPGTLESYILISSVGPSQNENLKRKRFRSKMALFYEIKA